MMAYASSADERQSSTYISLALGKSHEACNKAEQDLRDALSNVAKNLQIQTIVAKAGEVFAASLVAEKPKLLGITPPPDQSKTRNITRDPSIPLRWQWFIEPLAGTCVATPRTVSFTFYRDQMNGDMMTGSKTAKVVIDSSLIGCGNYLTGLLKAFETSWVEGALGTFLTIVAAIWAKFSQIRDFFTKLAQKIRKKPKASPTPATPPNLG
ncbi:hypothetical protein EOE18_03665 [Novosphingobium umbonatum]|uniref:Uncharacterized protein n=1 Tax=Novosphingobium umbonatum TaxID=1908524 RepID=A0A3S2VVS6_9SPHN|nr:hypothetical protein [Novosphingobium umbonatum]RVU07061.1 hypothetical protein EOE18_03665 [Novosphingobium umbonatum]